MSHEAFVYMWFDLTTGRKYIGCHKGNPTDGYVCSSMPMMREYNQRPQDFHRQIIEYGTWKDMLEREQALINEYNAVKDPTFYNRSNNIGPFHAAGEPCSEKTRAKKSAAQKGKRHSDETRIKIRAARAKQVMLPVSEETRNKIAKSLTGKKATEEHRANLSKSHMGHKPSEETKAKMSAAQKGRKQGPRSEEAKENMRKAWVLRRANGKGGGPHTEEAKENMRKAWVLRRAKSQKTK